LDEQMQKVHWANGLGQNYLCPCPKSCAIIWEMLPYKALRLRAVLVHALVLAFVQPVFAQRFNFRDGQTPLAMLTGPWRFHTGDNLRGPIPDLSGPPGDTRPGLVWHE
jgi:hypothetical protein